MIDEIQTKFKYSDKQVFPENDANKQYCQAPLLFWTDFIERIADKKEGENTFLNCS